MITKYIFLILIVIILPFYSCIDTSAPSPPEVTVSHDTIAVISPIHDITYTINANSSEELIKFELTSSPSIFKKDSTFENFVYVNSFYFKLKLPDNLPPLPDDSIITLSFHVYDSENTTTIQRSLKVIPGYTAIYKYTVELNAPPDSNFFYSTSNNETYILDSLNEQATDLVFIYDSQLGYTICSPDASWVLEKLLEFGLDSLENKNHTKIKTITDVSWDIMDFIYIYGLTLTQENINDIPSNGVGVDRLSTDDIIAIETHDGRKGVLKITEISKDAEKITFVIRIQKE